jgi:hypothetical protein
LNLNETDEKMLTDGGKKAVLATYPIEFRNSML